MKTLPKVVRTIGRIWICLAISWIVLSFCLNVIFSNRPIAYLSFFFVNIWNLFWNAFIAILIILPGYLLTEASEKIANRYGDSFKKSDDILQSTKMPYLTNIFASKIFLSLAIIVYLILMVYFVISNNG